MLTGDTCQSKSHSSRTAAVSWSFVLGILVYPTPLCCSPPLSSSCATPLPCHCMFVYLALVLWASVWVYVGTYHIRDSGQSVLFEHYCPT